MRSTFVACFLAAAVSLTAAGCSDVFGGNVFSENSSAEGSSLDIRTARSTYALATFYAAADELTVYALYPNGKTVKVPVKNVDIAIGGTKVAGEGTASSFKFKKSGYYKVTALWNGVSGYTYLTAGTVSDGTPSDGGDGGGIDDGTGINIGFVWTN